MVVDETQFVALAGDDVGLEDAGVFGVVLGGGVGGVGGIPDFAPWALGWPIVVMFGVETAHRSPSNAKKYPSFALGPPPYVLRSAGANSCMSRRPWAEAGSPTRSTNAHAVRHDVKRFCVMVLIHLGLRVVT